MPKLTKEKVLNITKHYKQFTVHRFKFSQGYLRTICKQLEKENKLVFDGKSTDVFFYKLP